MRNFFITGATGIVGSYLTKILLEGKNKVFVLSRNKENKSALERVKEVLNFWDKKLLKKYSDNLIVLEGDITKEELGLDRSDKMIIQNSVEEIFHCAAVTKVNWSLNKIRKVNVEGVRNILNLALTIKNLRKINHISTFAICGDYKGEFSEFSLDVGQKFHTSYEYTKFLAEKLVEKYRKKGLWIDIYRLPLIIGESKKGKILKFENIYQFFSICSSRIFNTLPLLNTHLYIAPLDYVCSGLYILSQNEQTKNKTYHLLPLKPISVEGIINIASQIMKFKKPRLVSFEKFSEKNLTPVQRLILKNTIFAVNLKTNIKSNFTDNLLKKYHFSFPKIDEKIISCILEYFNSKRRESFKEKKVSKITNGI